MSPSETTAESAPIEYNRNAIPKLLSVKTADFRRKYGQWVTFHDEILPPEDKVKKRGSSGENAPTTHKEFDQGYEKASQLHQNLINELTSMLRECEKDDDKVNGEPMWRHQKALIIEFIQMLSQRRYNDEELKNFLMEEAPGSGKTRIMGIIIAALSRMMVRGVFDGNILVLVRRKTIVMQQTLTKSEMRKTLLSKEFTKMRHREVKEQSKYATQEFRGSTFDFFPHDVWLAICKEEPETPEAAEQLIIASLQERDNLWDEFIRYPHHERVLHELACFASHRGGIALAANGVDLEFMELSAPEESQEHEGKGDLLFGVPQELFDQGHVFIQSDFDTLGGKEGARPNDNSRIAVMALTSTYQHGVRKKMAPFLRNVDFGFLDEAGKMNPSSIARMGMHPDIGGETEAHVFAATAYRDPKSTGYEGNFSHFTVEDAINSPDKVLKSPRMHVFPGHEGVRFPSGSYEAAEQLIKKFGEKLALPAALDAPQAIEDGSQLVVVHKDLVPYVTMRLRQEYGDTGIRFIPYNTNSLQEEHAGRIQLRMSDPVHTRTCLVGSMDRVVDSFDWRRLRATFMGIKESNASMEFMQRLFGRQFHSMLEDGSIYQQLFHDHDLRNRLPWLAYANDAQIPAAGPITLHPGQRFIGADECAAQVDAINGHSIKAQKTWSASTKKEYDAHVRAAHKCTTPKDHPHGLSDQSFVIEFPQIAAKVPGNQHAVGVTYMKQFAGVNGLDHCIDEFTTALRSAGKGDAVRAEALKRVALEYKLKEVLQISTTAQGNIAAAQREHNTTHPTRAQWEQAVAEEAGKAKSARAKVVKLRKPRSAPEKSKKDPGASYADRVLDQTAFVDRKRGDASEHFVPTASDRADESSDFEDDFDDDDDFQDDAEVDHYSSDYPDDDDDFF